MAFKEAIEVRKAEIVAQRPNVLYVQVLGYVNRVKDVTANVDNSTFTAGEVESNEVRCPDQDAAQRMWDSEPPSQFEL